MDADRNVAFIVAVGCSEFSWTGGGNAAVVSSR